VPLYVSDATDVNRLTAECRNESALYMKIQFLPHRDQYAAIINCSTLVLCGKRLPRYCVNHAKRTNLLR